VYAVRVSFFQIEWCPHPSRAPAVEILKRPLYSQYAFFIVNVFGKLSSKTNFENFSGSSPSHAPVQYR